MQGASSAVTVTSETTSITVTWNADANTQNLTIYLNGVEKTTLVPSNDGQYTLDNLDPSTDYPIQVIGFLNSGSQTTFIDVIKSTSEYKFTQSTLLTPRNTFCYQKPAAGLRASDTDRDLNEVAG